MSFCVCVVMLLTASLLFLVLYVCESVRARVRQLPISLVLSVEGHLWKAQWKEKPNDEGHSKLTMNS